MIDIKSICRISITALLVAVFCVLTTDVVDAKTLTTSNSFISQEAYNYFDDVYSREDYKYSILASEHYQNSAYNYVSYYYLCLTNNEVDVSDSTNVTATCEKLLRYQRVDNSYSATILSDNELKVEDTLYYYLDKKDYYVESHLFIIAILSCLSFLTLVLLVIFRW